MDRGGAAVDNRRPLPPIVRESFVTPHAAVVREARRDAVSCWRPSWQNPATAKSERQLEALEAVRGRACSFLTSMVSRAPSQALRARVKDREDVEEADLLGDRVWAYEAT